MFNGAKLTEVAKHGTQKINTVTKDLVMTARLDWMPMNQQTVGQLFSHFKVEKAGPNLLESTQFKHWATSVSKLYKTNSEGANMAMVSTLTVQYQDEALARMLAAAREVPGTKDVATNLFNAQMKYWISEKKSADQVFRYLELDQAGENVLASPLLKRWMKFVQQKSEDPYRALYLDLSTRFDDKGLANVLLGSKVGFGKKFDYHKLDDLVVQKWVDSKKTVDDVYELLKLRNVESSDFLQNPAVNTWVSFVTKRLDIPNTSPHELLYRKLITQYDDKGLANVLLSPKGDFGEKFDFLKFDNLILQKWVDSGKTVDDAYDLLKLRNVESSDFLQSPALENWLSFVTKLSSRLDNPNKGPPELLYGKLVSQYNDNELANVLLGLKGGFGEKFELHKLDDLVLQKWVDSGKTVDDVYTLLKLGDGKTILQNPALETWLAFMTKLNSPLHNPYEET
ncbi:RxLR effector protein [Phytophthora megakarya]|uniref:RxLR effector protein n=1 Tax=Phytophthora megakarya TaxID=4795 RepID=A0A225WBA0_9STRA|nr:RxLR effector protein [Phytophthora megakarya]